MNDKNGKPLRAGMAVALFATVLSVSESTQEKKDAAGNTTQGADPGSVTVQAKDGHTIVLPGDVLEVQDQGAQTTGGAAPTARTGQPGSGVSGQIGTSAAENTGGANRQMVPGSTGDASSTQSSAPASAGASTLGNQGSSTAQGGSASSSSGTTK